MWLIFSTKLPRLLVVQPIWVKAFFSHINQADHKEAQSSWTWKQCYWYNICQEIRLSYTPKDKKDERFLLIHASSSTDHHNSYSQENPMRLIFWSLLFLFCPWGLQELPEYLFENFHASCEKRRADLLRIIYDSQSFLLLAPICL